MYPVQIEGHNCCLIMEMQGRVMLNYFASFSLILCFYNVCINSCILHGGINVSDYYNKSIFRQNILVCKNIFKAHNVTLVMNMIFSQGFRA